MELKSTLKGNKKQINDCLHIDKYLKSCDKLYPVILVTGQLD